MNYQEIKRKHNLTDIEIAKMFGYKNASSFSTSSAKKRIEKGIENFYNRVSNYRSRSTCMVSWRINSTKVSNK